MIKNDWKIFVFSFFIVVFAGIIILIFLYDSLISQSSSYISGDKTKKKMIIEDSKNKQGFIPRVNKEIKWCSNELIKGVKEFPSPEGQTVSKAVEDWVKDYNGKVITWTIKEDYRKKGICWVRAGLWVPDPLKIKEFVPSLKGEKTFWISWKIYPGLPEWDRVEPSSPLAIMLTDRKGPPIEEEQVRECLLKGLRRVQRSDLLNQNKVILRNYEQMVWQVDIQSVDGQNYLWLINLEKGSMDPNNVNAGSVTPKSINCGIKIQSSCGANSIKKIQNYFSYDERKNLWQQLREIARREKKEKGIDISWLNWGTKIESTDRCLVYIDYNENQVLKREWWRIQTSPSGDIEVEPLTGRAKEVILGPGVGREQ